MIRQRGFAHIVLLLAIVIAVIGGVGYLMYQNGQLGQIVEVTEEQESNTVTEEENNTTPTPDVTTDWETYTDDYYNFSLKYPKDWILSCNTPQNDEWFDRNICDLRAPNTLIDHGLLSGGAYISIGTSKPNINYSSFDEYVNYARQRDDTILLPKTVNNISGYELTHSNEYDSSFMFEARDHFLSVTWIVLDNENQYFNTQNQILSTFEFVDQVATPTKENVDNIPISDTTNWKSAKIENITFKVPQDYTCKSLGGEEDYQNCRLLYPPPVEVNGKLVEILIPSRITSEYYEGGSRRKQYDPDNSTSFCKPLYKEGMFGNIKALQIAIDSGECQGGGGGIVAVVGNQLVTFHNLSYDINTNIINRWLIRDTIVSTFKSNE